MIYVDDLFVYPPTGEIWCHMGTDGEQSELDTFADRLGLKRIWKHRDHYDLTPSMRRRAVQLGAEQVSAAVFVRKVRVKRREVQP